MDQLVVKRLGILLGLEIAALGSPVGDGVRDAADELLDARFTFGRR